MMKKISQILPVFVVLLTVLCFPILLTATEDPCMDAAEKAKIAKENNNQLFMSKIYAKAELAETYKKANTPDKAIEMFKTIAATEVPQDFSQEMKTELIFQKISALGGVKDIYIDAKSDKVNARKTLMETIPLLEMLDPNDPEVKTKKVFLYKDIGQILREEGQMEEAIKYLEKASQME